MNKVFVDTAAWIALLNMDDVWHQKATQLRLNLLSENYFFITSNFVLLEVADALCSLRFRKNTADFLNNISPLQSTRVIILNDNLF